MRQSEITAVMANVYKDTDTIIYPITSTANAATARVPAFIQYIQTRYHTLASSGGGALYKKSAVGPDTIGYPSWYRTITDGYPGWIQTAGGQWWMLYATEEITPQQFGALATGSAANVQADSNGVQSALYFASYYRTPIYAPMGTYMIDGYKGAKLTWTSGLNAHGGMIIRGPVTLRGAGAQKTIFKNCVANWRCVFLMYNDVDMDVSGFTIDGDIANYAQIPWGSTSATVGSIRGEGLIMTGSGAVVANGVKFRIRDLNIINTGHYGIGIQNVKVEMGSIKGIYFENIGGDCIDVKTYPDFRKNLTIDDIFVKDGCGNAYDPDADSGSDEYDQQACIDIGGYADVSNVVINGLQLKAPGQTGCVGVRFRTSVTAIGRESSRTSSATNIKVFGTGDTSTYTYESGRVIGIDILANDVALSNAYVDGCYIGVDIARGTADVNDSYPTNVSVTNVTVKNIRGNTGATTAQVSMGLLVGSSTTGISVYGFHAENCDNGLVHRGADSHYDGLSFITCTNGITSTNASLNNRNTIGSVKFVGCTVNHTYTNVSNSVIHSGASMVGARNIWNEYISTADDSNWNSGGEWIGGSKYFVTDTSTSVPGEVMREGVRATGTSGAAWLWAVEFPGGIRPITIGSTSITINGSTPMTINSGFSVAGARQLYQTFASTANDSNWTGDAIWLGANIYTTADATGTIGEVVRFGARATGSTGASFNYVVSMYGTIALTIVASGAATFASSLQANSLLIGGANQVIDSNRIIKDRDYTVTQIQALTGMVVGNCVYCTNPTTGAPRPYWYSGTNWYDATGTLLA